MIYLIGLIYLLGIVYNLISFIYLGIREYFNTKNNPYQDMNIHFKPILLVVLSSWGYWLVIIGDEYR